MYYCCTPIVCSFSPPKRFHFYMAGQGEWLFRIEVTPVNTGGCSVQSATILITPFNHPRRQTYPYKNALRLMVCYLQFSFTSFRLLWCNIAPTENDKTWQKTKVLNLISLQGVSLSLTSVLNPQVLMLIKTILLHFLVS
jgi:hypothetical protein